MEPVTAHAAEALDETRSSPLDALLLLVEPLLTFFPHTDVEVRLLYGDATASTAAIVFDELEVQYCT